MKYQLLKNKGDGLARVILAIISIVCATLSYTGIASAESKESFSDLRKSVYVYQQQSMKEVNWMYIGLAPRMEDPNRISVTFSKASYTMRVTMKMTRREVADYPAYLYRRATEMDAIIRDKNIQIFQWWRYSQFQRYVHDLAKTYDVLPNDSQEKFAGGLQLLQTHFPTNIFLLDSTKVNSPEDVAVIAHFVYPITINRGGKSWPPDGTYVQKETWKGIVNSPDDLVEERRTDHGYWKDGERVISDYIFSGFPAFWLDPEGKGTGVHGPIRYSEPGEDINAQWEANSTLNYKSDITKDLDVTYRWDVVRTKNSAGCFRAESMELRHLLPTDPNKIFKHLQWKVISEPDQIFDPIREQWKWVDVDYYVVSPYQKKMTRQAWYEKHKEELVPNYLENSYQFEYLDPATLEFRLPGAFSQSASKRAMTVLNHAGGETFY